MARERRNKTFYIHAELRGAVAVSIDAPTKREALERLRNGSWDDVYDVSFDTVGAVHVEINEARQ